MKQKVISVKLIVEAIIKTNEEVNLKEWEDVYRDDPALILETKGASITIEVNKLED